MKLYKSFRKWHIKNTGKHVQNFVDNFNLEKYIKNYHIPTLKCNINLGTAYL